MLDTIIGFKQNMGAVYIADRRFTVTWVKAAPCVVTQVKNIEKDGYKAVQLAVGRKKSKNLSKPLIGHLKKREGDQNETPLYLREIKMSGETDIKAGDTVKLADVLKKADIVTVTGKSKGKGFAGVVKRWRFAGGPKTHGQSDRERAPGSIGQRTTPGRVYKGKKMAGRMGGDKITVKNLLVVDIDETNDLIALTGAVPGKVGGLVFIRKTGEGTTEIKEPERKVVEGEKEEEKAVDEKPEIKEAEKGEEKKEDKSKLEEKEAEAKEDKKADSSK